MSARPERSIIDGAPIGDEGGLPDDHEARLGAAIAKVMGALRVLPHDHEAVRGIPEIADWHEQWRTILFERIRPASAPRRGKRAAMSPEMQIVFNEAALAALSLPSALEPEINRALATGDAETFRVIAAAMEAVQSAPASHTKFSRHCYFALSAAREIRDRQGRDPKKEQVRDAVIQSMTAAGCEYFDVTEGQRWTEVWNVAGLSHLPGGNDNSLRNDVT